MKRRTFLGSLLSLFAAPVVGALPEKSGAYLVDEAVVMIPHDPRWVAGGGYGMSVRELYKIELAQWFQDQWDRQVLESLAGVDDGIPVQSER